jgi:hypothetical protein
MTQSGLKTRRGGTFQCLCWDQRLDTCNYANQNDGCDQAIFYAHEGIHPCLPNISIGPFLHLKVYARRPRSQADGAFNITWLKGPPTEHASVIVRG